MRKSFLSVLCAILLLCGLNNPVFAGIDFDAVDDLLSCGTSDNLLQENQAHTVSAWIYPEGLGGGSTGRIICKELAGSNGILYVMRATASFGFFVSGTTSLVRTASNNSLTLNAWNHVLMTWDGSGTATNSKLYVNGTEVSYQTTTNGSGFGNNAASAIMIGNQDLGTRGFDGRITEVAVWSSILGAQDISILSNSRVKRMPLQISPSNLKAYWPLDEEEDGSSSDADSFFDLSSNGNTCIGNNGANNTGLTAKAEEVLSYP